MTSWEEGIFCIESEYYIYTENAPYSAPFTFKAILESGQEVEAQNVINSMEAGDSGSLSAPPADSGQKSKKSKSAYGSESYSEYGGNNWWIWIVIPLVLFIVSMIYVFWKMRPSANVSVEDELSKSEMMTTAETNGNGNSAEGMETNDNAIEIVVRS